MGLFDKLKHGLQGSGVHTEIDGPGWVSSDQPGIDLAISFTAKEEPAVLEGYVVTLAREVEEQQMGGFNNMNGMGNTETREEGPTQVVAQESSPHRTSAEGPRRD